MICKYCGKESNVVYGKGIFCSRACASGYIFKNNPKVKEARDTRNRLLHEKALLSKKEREKKIKEEKERRKEIASQKGNCKFCGKECKNQNSLRNHERFCKKNPNKVVFERSPESEQKRLQSLGIANRNKDYSRKLYSCQFCKIEWMTTKTGWHLHEVYCHSNPNRKSGTFKGRKRTEEEKRKISEGQKLAHKEGRNCSWIGRRKRSFAEQFWYDVFVGDLGENSFENNYKVPNSKSAYFLDFAWPDKKLYFEVDGETHYSEEGKKHDEERTKFLQDKGWILICRCRWSDFQKLSGDEKHSYIQGIEMQIK